MPKKNKIHPDTKIGHVHLKVSNLERALNFYCEILGLELYWDKPKEVWPKDAAGNLLMFTHPLDLNNLLKEN